MVTGGKHGFQLCGKQKSLSRLRREIAILQGFYQRQLVYRLAGDLNVDIKTVTRVYQRLRIALFHIAELEGAKVSFAAFWKGMAAFIPRSWSRSRPKP